jgi:putative hydrolase of the HAD superfamily
MTNAQAWALAHFSRTLARPFDLELSCDDAMCEKPDPRYFAYARGRCEGAWGYRQPDNLHVAQSQYHDIGIAKKLGIATCWIERRHGMKDSGGTIESERTVPDYHFRTLGELADAVDAGR